jgi:hypothetical protein
MKVEAAPRFELGMELLQSSALPLGYAASDIKIVPSLTAPVKDSPRSLAVPVYNFPPAASNYT